MVQTFKAENCDMVEESFEDIEKLSELDRVELFNAVQKIEDLKGEKCLLTQKIRKEILNTTLIRRLDL